MTDKHQTPIKLQTDMFVSPAKPDRVHGAPDAYRRIHPLVSTGDKLERRCRSSNMQGTSPFARPDGFPIRTHDFPEEGASLSARYHMTYRLRFGVDFWMVGARQLAMPYDEVFVEELPDTIGKRELQRFLKLQHPNIHAVLDAFHTGNTRHVVFEFMEVSLHEIATIGINTVELATILKQVRVLTTAND
jgi:hypothetical protein